MLKHLEVTVISKGHFYIQHLTIQYVKVMYYTRKTQNQNIFAQENLAIEYIEFTGLHFSRPKHCQRGTQCEF